MPLDFKVPHIIESVEIYFLPKAQPSSEGLKGEYLTSKKITDSELSL